MYGFVRMSCLGLCVAVTFPVFAAKQIDVAKNSNNAEIQKIIDDASAGDVIVFAVGTYDVNLQLKSSLTLRGAEAARTILKGVKNGQPALLIDGVTNVTVLRLTVVNAETGVTVRGGSSDVKISNNIFQLNSGGTGVSIEDSADAMVRNNTFHGNGTGVSRTTGTSRIEYNIFSGNRRAITVTNADGINYNCFAGNTDNGEAGAHAVTSSMQPGYANSGAGDPELRDFHLAENSLCIDLAGAPATDAIDGSTLDAGAYGGLDADPLPYPVQNLKWDVTPNNGTYDISLNWSANNSYLVTRAKDPGNYLIYYNSDTSGAPYANTDKVAAPTTSFIVHGVTGEVAVPGDPVISGVLPASQELTVSWSEVPGASAYRLYYVAPNVTEESVVVDNGTSYTLKGLRNDVEYSLEVAALSAKYYYLTVVVEASPELLAGREVFHSDFAQEQKAMIGERVEGARSAAVTGTPERLQPYPQLANEGCFIATAAFGYYDAREIKPLRQFRDQYLLPYAPGRSFVAWYYRQGPVAARWLHRNAEFKPAVRVLLAPLIAVAWCVVNWPLFSLCFLVGVAMVGARVLPWRRYVQGVAS